EMLPRELGGIEGGVAVGVQGGPCYVWLELDGVGLLDEDIELLEAVPGVGAVGVVWSFRGGAPGRRARAARCGPGARAAGGLAGPASCSFVLPSARPAGRRWSRAAVITCTFIGEAAHGRQQVQGENEAVSRAHEDSPVARRS